MSTLELRVVITALTLVLLGVVVFGLLPSLCDIVESQLFQRIEKSRLAPPTYLTDRLPEIVSTALITRISQAAFTVSIGFFLLSIWGEYETAREALYVSAMILPYVTKAVLTAGIVVIGYAATIAISDRLDKSSHQYKHVDDHQIEIVARTFQLIAIGTTIVMLLAVWEINIGNILLGAGILGVVIGFAIRETLAAILAGFLLMFSRPFEIGDWIEIGEKSGTVTKITILNTRLRNADGERIIVPNDRVTSQTVVNRTRMNRLRLRVTVGIDYQTDIDRASDVALDAVREVEEVCNAPSPEVIPQEFDDSSITLEARFWIDNPTARLRDCATAKVIQSIKGRFDDEGIEIPFPQRTVSRRPTDDADAQGADTEV